MIDYYKVLGLEFNALESDIKKAFHSKIKLLHPDTGIYNEKEFHLVLDAYHILSDTKSRDNYSQKYVRYLNLKALKREEKVFLDRRRIIFPNSLQAMIRKVKILDKKRYRYLSQNFKEDLLIFISKKEALRGISFDLTLPIRQVCPRCFGNSWDCGLCEGKGYITSSHPFRVHLERPVLLNQIYNIPIQGKPFKGAYFVTRKLKLGVYLMNEESSLP